MWLPLLETFFLGFKHQCEFGCTNKQSVKLASHVWFVSLKTLLSEAINFHLRIASPSALSYTTILAACFVTVAPLIHLHLAHSL